VTSDSKTGQLNFNSTKLTTALNSDPTAVRRLLSRFGDVISGNNASFVSSTANTKAGVYEAEVTQARTRAEVTATSNAAPITVAESLTIRINKDAQGNGNVASMVINLDVGLTVAEQIAKIQSTFDTKGVNVSVALESDKIVARHNEYGDDFKIEIESSLANGESGFTNVVANHTNIGTDLAGKINGVTVTSDGDVLVGKDGFAFDDLRIRISNDFSGSAGTIRVNDGLGSSFTSLLDGFVGLGGVLNTKINSFDSTISRIESQITRVTDRATLLETRLRKKFVNLEVTLGKLNATGDYLSAQLKALPGIQINKKN
jgi:flagellar hook-associated protein 2